LAADKRRWGGEYDDSRGLRYAPLQLYVKLGDFTGGLRYTNWFHKNFPDDVCHPSFLMEWAIVNYKTGRIKVAEQKAFLAFYELLGYKTRYGDEKFFDAENINANLEIQKFFEWVLNFIKEVGNLSDFEVWLKEFIGSERFITSINTVIDLYRKLENENYYPEREKLLKKIRKIGKEF